MKRLFTFFLFFTIAITSLSSSASSPPQNFSASVSGNSVSFSWAPSPASGVCLGDPCIFDRYMLQQSGVGNFIPVSSSRATSSFALTGIPNGQYSFTLRAYYLIGGDDYANYATQAISVVVDASVPPTLGNVNAIVNNSAVDVSWPVAAGAATYQLQRNSADLASVSAINYKDTSASPGVSYTYRVRACNATGCSSWVNSPSVTIPPPLVEPSPPQNFSASVSGGSVSFSWVPSSVASGVCLGDPCVFDRYMLQQSGVGNFIPVSSSRTTSSFALTGIPNGQYSFTLRAYYLIGGNDYANYATQTISVVVDASVPPTPGNVNAIVNNSAVDVSWPVAAGAATYQLQRNFADLASVSAINYKDTSALPSVSYTYRVRACNAIGCSGWVSSAPVTIPSVPTTPAKITATPGSSSIAVGWSLSGGTATYELQRNSAALTSVTTTSYTDRGVAINTSYVYRVRACNATGCSEWTTSSPVQLITAPSSSRSSAISSSIRSSLSSLSSSLRSSNSSMRSSSSSLRSSSSKINSSSRSSSSSLSSSLRSSSSSFRSSSSVSNSSSYSSIVWDKVGFDPINDDLGSYPLYLGDFSGKYSVDESGAFNYSIPVVVPPGISSMEPELLLTYNSKNGNGLLGYGWSVSEVSSSIHRCRSDLVRDGKVSGTKDGDAFKYCLDGARMVEVSLGEYRLENDPTKKIVKHGGSGFPLGWTVYSKDGKIYEYGNSVDAVVKQAEFYLKNKKDRSGNYATYYYGGSENNTQKISSISYTKNENGLQGLNNEVVFLYESRGDTISRYVSGYRKQIKERLKEVVIKVNSNQIRKYKFEYEQLDANSYADPAATSRLTKLSKCEFYNNCTEIKFKWNDYGLLQLAADTSQSDYSLSESDDITDNKIISDSDQNEFFYEGNNKPTEAPPAGESFLIGHTQVRGDFDGDNKKELLWAHCDTWCYYYVRMDKESAPQLIDSIIHYNQADQIEKSPGVFELTTYDDKYWPVAADINGDGLDDLLLKSMHSGTKVYISNGANLIYSDAYSIKGKDLRKTLNSQGQRVGFWGYYTTLEDINGDGLLDFIKMPAVNENIDAIQSIHSETGESGIYVAINNGSGFDNFSRWGTMTDYKTSYKAKATNPYIVNLMLEDLPSLGKMSVAQFADVNGDGMKDILGYLPGIGVEVGINTGSSFEYQNNWADWASPAIQLSEPPMKRYGFYICPYDGSPEGIFIGNYIHESVRYGDVNGDGLTDILYLLDSGLYVSIATGSSYLAPTLWSNDLTLKLAVCGGDTFHDLDGPYVKKGKINWKVMDFNKDGQADIGMTITNTLETPRKNYVKIMLSVGGGQDNLGAFSAPVTLYSELYNSHGRYPLVLNDVDVSENGDLFVRTGLKFKQDQLYPNYPAGADLRELMRNRGMYRVPLRSHEIEQITTANGASVIKVDVLYKNLNRNTSIYTETDFARQLTKFMPATPSIYSSGDGGLVKEYDPTRSAYVPKLRAVSKFVVTVDGNEQQESIYKYQNYRFDKKGWGSLGFQHIENRIAFEDRALLKSTEYIQEVDSGYVLVAPKLVETSAIRLGTGEYDYHKQMIEADRFRYKVRLYSDDIDGFVSPRYLNFLVEKETKNYDFDDGVLIDTTLTRNWDGGNQKKCDDFTPDSSLQRTYNSAPYVDEFGTFIDVKTVSCNGLGVVGERTENTAIENDKVSWNIGLVKNPYKHSWVYDVASDTLQTTVRHSSFVFDNKGRVKTETREPNASATIKLTIERTYNGYGSIFTISETVEDFSGDGVDFSLRSITKNERFEANGDREIETVNDYGHVLTQVFEPVFGLERDTIDVNGLVTSRLYDRAGRLTKVTYPDDTKEEFQYRSCNSCFEYNNSAAWLLQTKVTGKSAEVEYFDGLNRAIGTKSRTLNGDYNFTTNEYNSDGTLHSFSAPFRGGSTIFKTVHGYDSLGRVVSTQFPNSGLQYVDFHMDAGVVATTTTDSLGNKKTQQFDALNREKKIIDSLGTITSYNYDALGNIQKIEVKGKSGELPISHSIKYDLLSRKIELNDPDVGKITYAYNAFGHLVSQTNAENETVKYVYDKLDRQVTRIDPPSTTDLYSRTHTWSYDNKPDGVGLLGGVNGYDTQGRSFSEQYSYNNYSQLTDTDFLIDGNSYRISNVYDNFSRSIGLVYPTGFAVGYSYNNYGFNHKVVNARSKASLWSATNDDAYGNITHFSFGNGASTQKAFSPDTGLIDTIRVTKASETIQDHDYDFDTEGNLRKRSDRRVSITQNFCYDTLYRLTSNLLNQTCNDVINGNYASAQYAYNIHGNITKKDNISDYRYGENAGPHAVTFANGKSYQYDKAGRMKGGTGRIIEYSAFGKPVYLSRDAYQTQIVYGPLEKRIRRMDIESGALTTTTYVDKLYEKIISSTGIEHRHYVSDFGIYVVDEAAQQSYNVYQHFDHIGSIAAKTDDRAASTTKLLANEPWGQRQDKTWNGQVYPYLTGAARKEMTFGTTRGFTGHEHLDAVGLIHMNGRVYDPVLGRFVSPDPWIQDPKNSQSFNRYSYVWNNPLRYTDPTGEETCTLNGCSDQIDIATEEVKEEQITLTPEQEELFGAIAEPIIDYTPIIGDAKGIAEAAADPSAATIFGAGVGLIPVLGDYIKGLLKAKRGQEAVENLSAGIPNVNTPTDAKVDVDAPAAGTGGTSGELTTVSGNTYHGNSTGSSDSGGDPRVPMHPRTQDALDSVQNPSRTHGYCCEIDAINKALNAGDDVHGAKMGPVTLNESGRVLGPCSTCREVKKALGVN